MRKTKEQKAITLIALIITIVVLLILAVVAINAVTGDGIIQHAVNAKEDYGKAQDEEQDVLAYYEQYLKTEGKSGDWIQNKTIVKNVKTGQTIEVGEKVNYIATGSDYESGKWAVLGVENGNILLASKNLPNEVTLTDQKTAIFELNRACEGYDEGNYAVKGSSRSINADDINRVTGYNPLKTGDGKVYCEGSISQYKNKVTYTMDDDGRINYEFEYVPNGVAKKGQLPDNVKTCIDIEGRELVKESEYTPGVTGTATSLTITTTSYAYYPTSLTFDNENTNVNGISKDSKAYTFLFINQDLSACRYWLATLNSQIIDLVNGKFYGLHTYSANVVGSYGVGSGGNLNYSTVYKDSENTAQFSETEGVRAVITLESDVQLTKQSDGSYNID